MYDQVESLHKWSTTIFRTNIILTVISTAALAIRFIAKLKTTNFGLDDGFIVAAQVLCYAETGMNLYALHVGKSLVTMLDPGYGEYVKWVTMAGILYCPVVLCISTSILLFYRRIFPIASIKRLITIFLVVHVLWALAGFLGSVFICWPVELVWAPVMVQAANADKCMKYPIFFVIALSVELVLNAAVLAMPIKQTIGLKLNLQIRVMLVFVFLLGGVSLVSGILRIVETYIPGEPYVDLAVDTFWLGIHVNTALIAASLPIYRPLLRASLTFMSSTIRKVYGSGYDSKRPDGSSGAKVSEGYTSISDKQSQKSLVGTEQNSMES